MKLIVTVWSVVSGPRLKEWNNTSQDKARDRIGETEGRQSERRVLRVHGFPTVNKAINFIFQVLKLIRIDTAGTGEYNSTCLICQTSTTSANYGLLGRQGGWPHGRVAFYLRLPYARACMDDTTHVHTYAVAFAKLARVLAL